MNTPEPTSTPSPRQSAATAVPESSEIGASQDTLHFALSTLNSSVVPACREPLNPQVIDAQPLPATSTAPRRKARRTGRIACLPKLHRDLVNRMIDNGVPYKNIVAALDEVGFSVTERNISNWATGGYLEWRCEQDLVLQNRLDQDHLLDHLRRDDASELPEVGLQAAATRLSQILLQKTARADDVEANLGTFSQMVDVLCRLNREIGVLQKQRDDSRRSLGRAYDPARVKEEDQASALEHERFYSYPSPDSGLAKPEDPPLLPPPPTSSFLAERDREEAELKEAEHTARRMATLLALTGTKPHAPHVAQASLPASLPAGSAGVPLPRSLPTAPATSSNAKPFPPPHHSQ